jgi:hypothetical protein
MANMEAAQLMKQRCWPRNRLYPIRVMALLPVAPPPTVIVLTVC